VDNIVTLGNGMFVGCRVAEVTAIPYFELINKNLERANEENQLFFTQVLNSFHRKSRDGMSSLDLMFSSVEVNNQTYNAQLKMHLILRQMGTSVSEIEMQLDALENSLKNDFTDKFFEMDFFHDKEEMLNFEEHLKQINVSTVTSVAKKEDATVSMLTQEGYIYHTYIPTPAENCNTSAITNVLTQYPQSAVLLQIIPTRYNQSEVMGIEQISKLLQYYAANMMRQMMRPDRISQNLMQAYQTYLEEEKESLFYFNFLVCSSKYCAFDISNKLVDALEDSSKINGSSYEAVSLPLNHIDLAGLYPVLPWQISNILIFGERNPVIWNLPKKPEIFIRFKQLISTRELRAVFKIPIDDGKTIGIASKKVLINRDKLNDSIIAPDNFKVGIIKNAARNGFYDGAHAGIPLNQFTKHGLIVGMPGSGKTNFSLGLLLQFYQDFGIPFLAIEPTKTEYRSLIDAIPEMQIFTPGKNDVSPFVINPFIPPKGVTVESYTPSLAAAFKASFSMPNPLPDIFLSAINDCYTEYGWKKNSTLDDPDIELFGMYEFIKVFKKNIEHSNYKGETRANIESAGIVRLVSLIEQNSNIYDTVHTIPIEDLLRNPTVVELNAINNKEQKSLIMALLLILFCVYTKNNVSGDGKLKNILLIDEAHVLLGKGRGITVDGADSQGSTVETLEDLIKEIRAYGTGIIVADQSPTSVGREIVANTDVKVIFKLIEKDNKDIVSMATNMSDLNYELLGRLGVGEALLHYGKLDNHLQINTYNVHEKADIRDVIPDQEIKAAVHYWDNHKELLMAHRECSGNCFCENECDLTVRTNADFVATKLINEKLYKLDTKEEFLKFLVTMNSDIKNIVDHFGTITLTKKLVNCTKIKFLRKAMIKKDFGVSKEDYDRILRHPNFLLQK